MLKMVTYLDEGYLPLQTKSKNAPFIILKYIGNPVIILNKYINIIIRFAGSVGAKQSLIVALSLGSATQLPTIAKLPNTPINT